MSIDNEKLYPSRPTSFWEVLAPPVTKGTLAVLLSYAFLFVLIAYLPSAL